MKPSIFNYVNATQFLNDLFKYKKTLGKFSLRSWAKELKITPAYLCYLLQGKRPLQGKILNKIAQRLDLKSNERHFFMQIANYQFESTPVKKEKLLLEIGHTVNFRRSRPRDSLLSDYLSDPLAVFLREACALKHFKKDLDLLQKMFWFPVSKKEIQKKLNFLIANGFVALDEEGRMKPLEVSLDCSAEVLKVSMSRFHRKMFSIASEAISRLNRTERNLLGMVTPVSLRQFEEIHSLIGHTMQNIEQITLRDEPKSILAYVGLITFHLSDSLEKGAF